MCWCSRGRGSERRLHCWKCVLTACLGLWLVMHLFINFLLAVNAKLPQWVELWLRTPGHCGWTVGPPRDFSTGTHTHTHISHHMRAVFHPHWLSLLFKMLLSVFQYFPPNLRIWQIRSGFLVFELDFIPDTFMMRHTILTVKKTTTVAFISVSGTQSR